MTSLGFIPRSKQDTAAKASNQVTTLRKQLAHLKLALKYQPGSSQALQAQARFEAAAHVLQTTKTPMESSMDQPTAVPPSYPPIIKSLDEDD